MGKQKRSPNTYTKINTIFKRDINNCIMPYAGFVMPELEWMKDCKFDADEKIDGTCIRIEVSRTLTETMLTWQVDYKGKTDNAEIPKKLQEHLSATYPAEKVLNALGLTAEMSVDGPLTIENGWSAEIPNVGMSFVESNIPKMYTLYGEGYGAGIQSGGYYRKDNAFIGFDVKVGDMYLLRENRNAIFEKLECPIVPYIGQFTIQDAIEFVKKGFKSRIAEEDHLAEGLVLRSPYGVLTRKGDRIIFKVKTCDWDKYYAKYGTYDQVEQIPNPKIEY